MATGVHGVHMVTVTRNAVVAVSHDHALVTTLNHKVKVNNAKENHKVLKPVIHTTVQVKLDGNKSQLSWMSVMEPLK